MLCGFGFFSYIWVIRAFHINYTSITISLLLNGKINVTCRPSWEPPRRSWGLSRRRPTTSASRPQSRERSRNVPQRRKPDRKGNMKIKRSKLKEMCKCCFMIISAQAQYSTSLKYLLSICDSLKHRQKNRSFNTFMALKVWIESSKKERRSNETILPPQ